MSFSVRRDKRNFPLYKGARIKLMSVCGHLGRGLVQEIESPDFRSPEVGISGNV